MKETVTTTRNAQHTPTFDGCDIQTLQRDAQAADDAFHADLVRQFGDKRAGDMRYVPLSYDDLTAESAYKFRIAINRLHAAWDAQRVERQVFDLLEPIPSANQFPVAAIARAKGRTP